MRQLVIETSLSTSSFVASLTIDKGTETFLLKDIFNLSLVVREIKSHLNHGIFLWRKLFLQLNQL